MSEQTEPRINRGAVIQFLLCFLGSIFFGSQAWESIEAGDPLWVSALSLTTAVALFILAILGLERTEAFADEDADES